MDATKEENGGEAASGATLWDEDPLWGDQIKPGARQSKARSKQKASSNEHSAFREGNHDFGSITVRLGLLHLCCLSERHGIPKKRACREFHHYDGVEQSSDDGRSVVIIATFEGDKRRQIQAKSRSLLLFDSFWTFKVSNLRSVMSLDVFWAKRGDELDEAAYILAGTACITALALIEEQSVELLSLNETFHDLPVKKFEIFYRQGPQTDVLQKLNGPQRARVERLHWYDLHTAGDILSGRIGIQRYFDDGTSIERLKAYLSNARGLWEQEPAAAGSNFIFIGSGIPPRRPDKRRSIPEAFSVLFKYLNRIKAVVTYTANAVNAAAAVQSWSHWPTSLLWFTMLSLWSWCFRLNHLPQHVLVAILLNLFSNFANRWNGKNYVTNLTPSTTTGAAGRVKRHVANVKIWINTVDMERVMATHEKLHCQVAYLPGVGGFEEDSADSSHHRLMLNVGSADEVRREREDETSCRQFSVHGRSSNIIKRFSEMTLSKSIENGALLRNRTLIWKRGYNDEGRNHTNGQDGINGDLTDERRSGEAVVEALEYPVLQSVGHDNQEPRPLPWTQHTGRLIFFVRRDPTLKHAKYSQKTFGTAEVFLKDLVECEHGIQPESILRLPIRHVGDYNTTGDLNVVLQISLPDNPKQFSNLDRLKQEELGSVLSNDFLLKAPRPWAIQAWLTAKTDMANRNLQWLAYWGDDIYAFQNLFRWAHPWKTTSLTFLFIFMLLIVSTFPFHRLLFTFVLASFAEGFYSKFKWKFRKDKKPSKVEVTLFGMKLKCSRKSSLHRVRNLFNSLPNDRDDEEHFAPRRRAVEAREAFMRHCYAHICGDLWAGPLLFKWKMKQWSLRPTACVLNAKAFSDMRYRSRYVVIAPGFLRLFSGSGRGEASHKAAEGYEHLKACGGWITFGGNCTSLRISRATVTPWITRRGVPCVILNECAQENCASWRLSLCCFNENLRSSLVRVLCAAGCEEVEVRQDQEMCARLARKKEAASLYSYPGAPFGSEAQYT